MNDLMTKSFLSYVELKKQSKKDEESDDVEKGGFDFSPEDEQNLSLFFQEIETIKTLIEEITNLLLDLQTLNEETKSTHSNKILRGLRDRMESNIVSISRKANHVKTLIESLDKRNVANKASFKEGSCVDRTRVSITNGLRSKLRDTMSEFHRLRERIFADYKEDLKRKYFLATGEEPSSQDMEKMIVSGESCCIAFKTLATDIDTMKTKERHEAVNNVRRSLNRLHQVFLDMAVLVETQGDKIDDIEANVANASSFVSGGTNGLFYANQMKKNKNKNWVVCVCFLAVLVLIVCLVSMIASR